MSWLIVCVQTAVLRASFETVAKAALLTEFIKEAVSKTGGNHVRIIRKLQKLQRDGDNKSDVRGLCLLIRNIHSHVPDDTFHWRHLPLHELIRHCSGTIKPRRVHHMNRLSLGLLKSMTSALQMVGNRLMRLSIHVQ